MHRFAILSLIICALCLSSCAKKNNSNTSESQYDSAVAFSGDSCFSFVQRQVGFGPRVPSTKSHTQCGDYLVSKLKSYGVEVQEQTVQMTTFDGKKHNCRNILGHIRPESQKHILLIAHWDSRPFSDQETDPNMQSKPVDGANDGASGVAVILEICRQLQLKPANIGVDILLNDLEDYGKPNSSTEEDELTWCLGTQYWAKQAVLTGYTAEYAILLDMVGYPNATFPKEGFSMQYAPNIVDKIWTKARRLGHSDVFVNRQLGQITDDHLPVNQIARIPTVDVIHYDELGFGFYWHTQQDNISNVSPSMLQIVGQVILGVIRDEK